MRALIQRVSRAGVRVENRITGSIDRGLLVFVGVKHDDTEEDARYLASRICALRVFNDNEGKMNLSVHDVDGKLLVVSQFTLHADTRKGNRPSYGRAAAPDLAQHLYEIFISEAKAILGPDRIECGVFRAMMQVELVNDGPVTVMVSSKSEYRNSAESDSDRSA